MSEALRALHEEHSRVALTIYSKSSVSSKFPQYLSALLATLSALAAGTALAWTSPALPLLQADYSPIPITSEQGSWIGSLINLGAFFGALPAGMAADMLGRQRTLCLLALPMTASWLLIVFADSVYYLYGARFLGGMAIGAVSVATPMYIAELAETRVRGALGTFFQLQITVGIFLSYVVGLLEDYYMMAYICCGIPAVFLIFFAWMPESPMHLLSKDRKDEAKKALQWFRGKDFDAEDELTRMTDTVNESRGTKVTLGDLVKTRGMRKALVIALGLMFFQQMSGVNAVIFYTGEIFRSSGSTLPPNIATIIVGAVMVVSTYASTLLVDRAGRRVLLLVSDFIMALCLAVLGAYFYIQNLNIDFDLSQISWLPLLTINVFVVVFSIGFGPIPWMMLGELFPSKVKGLASALIASVNWLLAFTVTKVFQNMVQLLGIGVTFWVFSGLCVVGTIFVAVLVPETKGKDLEEIQAELSGRRRQIEEVVSVDKLFKKPV